MQSQDDLLAPIKAIEGNMDSIARLIEMFETPGGVIPFVGAGLSIPFGYPGWSEFLIKEAENAGIKEEIQRHLAAGEYEEAAQVLLTREQSFDFNNAIEAAFSPRKLGGRNLMGAVSYLPRLAAGPVITTNFDPVLEKVFEWAQRPFERIVYGSRFVGDGIKALYENRRFLVKIHGDVWNEDGRVLTRSDYQREYSSVGGTGIDFSLPLPGLLRQMLVGRPLLFLGCSLNQDRTVALLKQVLQDFRKIPVFAVVARPTDIEKFDERNQTLADLKIHRIWYPSGRHELIAPLLKEIADRTDPSPGVIARQRLELMQTMQERQQREITSLQFLLKSFVSQYEFEHLIKLASGERFPHTRNDAVIFFEKELRNLLDLHLIERQSGKGIAGPGGLLEGGAKSEVNVKDYLRITDKGKKYLEIRKQFEDVGVV